MLEKWEIGLKKVKAVVTDNAANIVKAAKLLYAPERPKQLGCFAHLLNLVVAEDAVKTTEGLNSLITKVKTIVCYFKQSTRAADALREKTDLKPIKVWQQDGIPLFTCYKDS